MSTSEIVAGLALVAVLAQPGTANADQRLVQAAARGDATAIRLLLRERVDVNAVDADGATALHFAVWSDDLATVDELIKAGANVRAANAFRITPIYIAAEQGNAGIVTRLLSAGADVNTVDGTGDTLLMAAVRAGNDDVVRLLLDRGAQVNAAEPELGHTALMWAVRDDNGAIVTMLLRHGAAVDARTRVGAKPDVRPPGAGGGSHGVGIVRSGVPPQGEQLPTPGGMTPLLFAARDGARAAAESLVKAGADVNAADPNGMTPLMMAITNGQLDVARYLVTAVRMSARQTGTVARRSGRRWRSAISICAAARPRTASIARRRCS